MKTFQYDAETTPPELLKALELVSEACPMLAKGPLPPSSGAIGIKFIKTDGSSCSCVRGEGIAVVTYGPVNLALRCVGQLVSDTLPMSCEKNVFKDFGIMLDCSRNAVPTVEKWRSRLIRLALLGYTSVLIYLEDVYELEGEPFFGLMRGRYSADELRKLDDYADALGIELIPCIQTLAHLKQIFRWPAYKDICDSGDVMLAGDGRVAALVDKMLAFWRKTVRSGRIHIGMDEAADIGRGRYRDIHGDVPHMDILFSHLKTVCALCEKHSFKPMMWSDMFFTLSNRSGDYYDVSEPLPASARGRMPAAAVPVYWDYIHTDPEICRKMLKRHRELGCEPVSAAALWTYLRFWYDHGYSSGTGAAMLEAAKKENISGFHLAMWGDDGGYCDFDSAFAGMAYFADMAFGTGSDASVDEKRLAVRFGILFGGASYNAAMAFAKISYMNLPSVIFDDPLMLMYLASAYYGKPHDAEGRAEPYTFDSLYKALGKVRPVLARAPKRGCGGNIGMPLALADALRAKMELAERMFTAHSSGWNTENRA